MVFIIFATLINKLRFQNKNMTDLHSAPKRLSSFAYIATFIVMFLILVIYADTFIFVLGTIGLVVISAFYYKDNSDAHH